jgi:signal transduction histidine kinase
MLRPNTSYYSFAFCDPSVTRNGIPALSIYRPCIYTIFYLMLKKQIACDKNFSMHVGEANMMGQMNVQPEPAKTAKNSYDSPLLNAEWLASLSHELRGPLTAIQGYARMLLRHEERISSEERHEFLQAITQGSDRIASVLDRFLDIAGLEAGTVQLHTLPVDMVQLVQDVLLAEQQEYPDHHVAFTLRPVNTSTSSLDQNLFVIQADDSLIRKMLVQLLDNAQKYSAACTPIEVTLSCYALTQKLTQIPARIYKQFQEPDQQIVEVSIQDQGIGIPIADHERIFERFERVDMQLTREVSGLGLGLTMCKYIVARHYGAIWVESIPGKGSTFHVLLPAARKGPTPFTYT